MGTMIYSDPETAFPLAILDGTTLTMKRTGAAAAVATDELAVPDATSLGIVGAGVQSYTQLEAIAAVRDIDEVVISDLDEERVADFIDAFEGRFDVRAGSIAEAGHCDVLSTVTPVESPIVGPDDVGDHTHVNAMGADAEGKHELADDLLLNATVVIDDHEQCTHSGEINVPYAAGLLTDDDIYGGSARSSSATVRVGPGPGAGRQCRERRRHRRRHRLRLHRPRDPGRGGRPRRLRAGRRQRQRLSVRPPRARGVARRSRLSASRPPRSPPGRFLSPALVGRPCNSSASRRSRRTEPSAGTARCRGPIEEADVRQYRERVAGSPVILGRRTFDSMRDHLPGSRQIVVSRSVESVDVPTAVVADGVDSALERAAEILDGEIATPTTPTPLTTPSTSSAAAGSTSCSSPTSTGWYSATSRGATRATRSTRRGTQRSGPSPPRPPTTGSHSASGSGAAPPDRDQRSPSMSPSAPPLLRRSRRFTENSRRKPRPSGRG